MMKFCCEKIKDAIEKYQAIEVEEEVRGFFINSLIKDEVSLALNFCPFCGHGLGKRLNSEYYDILYKEYGIKNPETTEADKVPPEFRTDEWWRKRGL